MLFSGCGVVMALGNVIIRSPGRAPSGRGAVPQSSGGSTAYHARESRMARSTYSRTSVSGSPPGAIPPSAIQSAPHSNGRTTRLLSAAASDRSHR